MQSAITYVAQVLKRNRTLKVINLAENKLDVSCLVAVAEALVRPFPFSFSHSLAKTNAHRRNTISASKHSVSAKSSAAVPTSTEYV